MAVEVAVKSTGSAMAAVEGAARSTGSATAVEVVVAKSTGSGNTEMRASPSDKNIQGSDWHRWLFLF